MKDLFVGTCLLLSLLPRAALAADRDWALPALHSLGSPQAVVASSGVFDLFNKGDGGEIGTEFHFVPRRFRWLPHRLPDLIPAAGIVAGSQGDLYAYGGFRFELPLGRRWMAAPGWAMGLYQRAHGKDLGGGLEFRSQIELSYRLGGGSRLGLCLYHLSNAGLFERNPGSESLVLTYRARLRQR